MHIHKPSGSGSPQTKFLLLPSKSCRLELDIPASQTLQMACTSASCGTLTTPCTSIAHSPGEFARASLSTSRENLTAGYACFPTSPEDWNSTERSPPCPSSIQPSTGAKDWEGELSKLQSLYGFTGQPVLPTICFEPRSFGKPVQLKLSRWKGWVKTNAWAVLARGYYKR